MKAEQWKLNLMKNEKLTIPFKKITNTSFFIKPKNCISHDVLICRISVI